MVFKKSKKTLKFTLKIAFNIGVEKKPFGGGNIFLEGLTKHLLEKKYIIRNDLKDNDIDIILILDPRYRHPSSNFSIGKIFRYIKFKNPNAIIVHRINECDERKNTNFMNKLLKISNYIADHTIFVGSWLKQLDLWEKKSSSVILNGSDKNIFYPNKNNILPPPYRLVSHHWSNNKMKGFDVYSKIDQLLNSSKWKMKIEFTYIGRLPKNFKFKNVKVIDPLYKKLLADELSNHHIYVTGSINEPGGNHQNEGALCGLPLLYRNSGCFEEYCEGYGVKFDFENFESSLNKIIDNYDFYKQKIKKYPHDINKTSNNYDKLFKNLLLEKTKILKERNLKKNFFKDIRLFLRP